MSRSVEVGEGAGIFIFLHRVKQLNSSLKDPSSHWSVVESGSGFGRMLKHAGGVRGFLELPPLSLWILLWRDARGSGAGLTLFQCALQHVLRGVCTGSDICGGLGVSLEVEDVSVLYGWMWDIGIQK